MNLRYGRVIRASVGILLLGSLLLALVGLLLWNRLTEARTATNQVQRSLEQRDLQRTCRSIDEAAAAWDEAASISAPLAPVLHRLGWLPHLGNDLRLLPDLITIANHGSAAGATSCDLLAPALTTTTNAARLTSIARALEAQPTAIARLRADVRDMRAAYTRIDPLLDHSRYLAPYRDQIRQLGVQLPTVETALAGLEANGAPLPWLLGLDAPRRFLVVLQNPFEIRPTGGFIGLVCVLRVAEAQPTVEGCTPSESFAAEAPGDWTMPFAYSRYLRLSRFYLRDANWSPDFPTSARLLQQFWTLNGQPEVDGVIAADPTVLVPLLQATGPLALDGGKPIAADGIVDAVMMRYYDGQVFRDKSSLTTLFTTVLQRVLQVEPGRLPAVAGAIRTALDERHLLVALDQPALAAMVADARWDGALQPDPGHTLRIVDADVGYGAVNPFVERLTHYDLQLDPAGTPLTATLTLTYTNSYSPWREAATPYAVFGQCSDPDSGQLMRQPGCYANYLRVYAPRDSQLLSIDGIDETLGTDQELDRQVFGGYLLVNPGQQRVVQLQYRLPRLQPGPILLEKQPGTLAPALLVSVVQGNQRVAQHLDLRTDRALAYHADNGTLSLNGDQQPTAVVAFERHAALVQGLADWQRGQAAAAVARWQRGDALADALSYARTLPVEQALALTAALAPVDETGQAAFEQATLLISSGQQSAALPFYQQAAAQGARNPLARLTWMAQLADSGQRLPPAAALPASSSAVRRWRLAVDELEQTGRLEQATTHLAVLLQLTPDDRAMTLRYADLLLHTDRRAEAAARYAALDGADIYGRLAAARQAQLAGNQSGALEQYVAALPLAATYETAFRVADGLRDAGDLAGALAAYQRTAELRPGSIWPLLAAGHALRPSDPVAARSWYEQARQLNPDSGYPDFAIGTLLLEAGDPDAARPFLAAAVGKQPEVTMFQEMLIRLSEGATPSVAQVTP